MTNEPQSLIAFLRFQREWSSLTLNGVWPQTYIGRRNFR